ncbi:MAG: tetratricopeptide repeat protein [bacterium]
MTFFVFLALPLMGASLFSPGPDFIPPGYLAARDSWQIEEYKRSLRQVKKVQRRYPAHLEAFGLYFRILARDNDFERLKEELEKIPGVPISAQKMYVLLESVDLSPGQELELIKWSFRKEENSSALQSRYISLLENTGQIQEAFRAAREGLELFSNPEFYLHAGRLALKTENFNRARQWLLKYRNIFPGRPAAYRQLARLYLARGEEEGAHEFYLRYRALAEEADVWEKFKN